MRCWCTGGGSDGEVCCLGCVVLGCRRHANLRANARLCCLLCHRLRGALCDLRWEGYMPALA